MTYATSSAEPSKLMRYSDVTTNIDSFLANAASPLNGALRHFEATCKEPGFRLQVSHVSDWLVTYANQANTVDFWVRQVGLGFLHADAGTVLGCIANWAWRAFQIAWDRFVDFVDNTRRKMQDALNKIVVRIGGAYTAAANGVTAAIDRFMRDTDLHEDLKSFANINILYDVVKNPLVGLVVVDSILSVIKDSGAPTPVKVDESEVKLPKNMQELYASIDKVPGDSPIQIIKIKEGEYLVLVKGTRNWVGASEVWFTNATSGVGYNSVYTERLEEIIKTQIPRGSTIHLAGHSQGGHAVQIVGSEFAQNGMYAIGSLTTFGSYYLSKTSNSNIANRNHYLFDNDILNLIDKGGVDEWLSPSGKLDEALHQERLLFDSTKWRPAQAHTDYASSQTLAGIGTPFQFEGEPTRTGANYDAPVEPPVTGAVVDAAVWSAVTVKTAASNYVAYKVEQISQAVQAANYCVYTAQQVTEAVVDTSVKAAFVVNDIATKTAEVAVETTVRTAEVAAEAMIKTAEVAGEATLKTIEIVGDAAVKTGEFAAETTVEVMDTVVEAVRGEAKGDDAEGAI